MDVERICPACQAENSEAARFCQGCGAFLPEPGADPAGLIGQVLGGRYRVTRVIAEGGMGVVYEAEQKMGDNVRRVAVKTLLPALSQDTTTIRRFHRESGLIAGLEHPNTVRVYDSGATPDGQLYIVMEWVSGAPLTALIEQGPIEVARVENILRQVCGALEEAHGKGIIHRDLKPDNIVLTERGGESDVVKVLDFGIAKRIGGAGDHRTKLTQQGVVLGTPPYMSPEQLAGEAVGPQSDVYSLGVIAYEMLTGRLPFDAETPWEWASKHMTVRPPPPHTFLDSPLPAHVERAVLHALEKRAADRPASAIAFYRELTGQARRVTAVEGARTELVPAVQYFPAVRTESAVAAPIPPPSARGGSKLGWVLAATGVVLGGALAATGLWFAREPQPTVTPAAQPEAPPPLTIAPLTEGPSDEPAPMTTVPEPVSKAPAPKPPARPPTTTAPPVTTAPPPVTTAPPPVTTAPPPVTTAPPSLPPPPSGPTGDALCQQSEAAARSGNIEGAASLYHRCQSTGGSAAALALARRRIRDQAPGEVRRRAFTGDCAAAQRAVSAAESVGEGAAARQGLTGSSC
ncbi:MAG: protein kinase [Polyangiaceae bacterium]|nr:protein kinase [Polyangiaceae bacterium]